MLELVTQLNYTNMPMDSILPQITPIDCHECYFMCVTAHTGSSLLLEFTTLSK